MAAIADDGAATTVRGFPVSEGWPLAAKPCDSCKAEAALLFCRADSAFLCMGCDGKVHGANKLAFRHERVWMCEVCEQAPAAVTCKADAAALCVSCDVDIHSANPLARRHDRIPVVPFFEPVASAARHHDSSGLFLPNPSSSASSEAEADASAAREEVEAASWLLPNPSSKLIEAPELRSGDFFFSDVDPYLDLDYTPSIDARFGFQNGDSLVPVQTKISASSLPLLTPPCSEPVISFADYPRPKPCYSFNTTIPSLSHSVSSSSMDVGVVPDGTDISFSGGGKCGMEVSEGMGSAVASAAVQLTGMDREARVLRYREKRKNRKFEKTIRYASRKAYAETRPRVKGRFAKRPTEMEAEIDRIYSSAAAFMAEDAGYGVVPSF